MTSFHDLADYVATPRVTALRLSPDGSWLAAAVQTAGGEPPAYVTSIWRIPVPGDAAPGPGDGLPARLTRSAEGEGSPEFLPDGTVLFISKRPDPARGRGKGADAGGPDADPGRDKPALHGSAGADDDRKRRRARQDAAVTAILHESRALRYWEHDLGPDSPRLQLAEIPGPGPRPAAGPTGAAALVADEDLVQAWDLTPDPGRTLDENSFDITPDGARVVIGWSVWDETGNKTDQVEVIDAATGERRTLPPRGAMTSPVRASGTSLMKGERPRDLSLELAAPQRPRRQPPVFVLVKPGAGHSQRPAGHRDRDAISPAGSDHGGHGYRPIVSLTHRATLGLSTSPVPSPARRSPYAAGLAPPAHPRPARRCPHHGAAYRR